MKQHLLRRLKSKIKRSRHKMVQKTYERMSYTYDNTRKADPGIVAQLIAQLEMKHAGRYLDVGCGSGNYTHALAQQGLMIEGIDISPNMLNQAKVKYKQMIFHNGDALHLPFDDNQFSGLFYILVMHHVKNYLQAFQEAYRTSKKDGEIVIFTTTPEQMQQCWLYHYFPNMMNDRIQQIESFGYIKKQLEQAGFSHIKQSPFHINDTIEDLFLYSGKFRPHIYLDPFIRQNISCFALSPHHDELYAGLQALKKDILSGKINTMIDKYISNIGDCLFITGKKCCD